MGGFAKSPDTSQKNRKLQNRKIMRGLIPFLFTPVLLAAVQAAYCSEVDMQHMAAETMLMFVGEELDVVTVASRHPESPSAAPAMATVVTRQTIEERGYQTLAELLADQPGFFMLGQGRGTTPYLRGIENGILFLYDTVPITTDVTKNMYPLGRELSLDGVSRVEIVRGPGSVLWGPDAFAGIVNVVPMRGRSHPGGRARVALGSGDHGSGYAGFGLQRESWDAFVFVSAVRERYHADTYDAWNGEDAVVVEAGIDPSQFLELGGNFHYGDHFSLSGRWSDFTRRYTMNNSDATLRWAGEKKSPFNFVKATFATSSGASHWLLTTYYQASRYRLADAGIERGQKNSVTFGELLYDRRLFGRGLLTAGVSHRISRVRGAVIADGFLPGFLAPDNTLFTPIIEQADFSNSLTSLFGQFRSHWQGVEWWLGCRLDDHSLYDATMSYSLGINYPFHEQWRLKATLGTAFRSPYASQLFGGERFEPEGIRTASVQFGWEPAPTRRLELTLFGSSLTDQRAEDPYGGLSSPTSMRLYGVEFAATVPLSETVRLSTSLTALAVSGGSQQYQALLYAYLRPDGSRLDVYTTWEEPLDTGPGVVANLGLDWSIMENLDLHLQGRMAQSLAWSYEKGTYSGRYSFKPLLDVTLVCKGLFRDQDTLTLRIVNLLDQDYQVPDIYGPADGQPLGVSVQWAGRF